MGHTQIVHAPPPTKKKKKIFVFVDVPMCDVGEEES
jgi:hypothetical protein